MIVNFTKKQMSYLVICITLMLPLVGWAQDDPEVLESASLDEIVDYALKHQPVLQQAKIDQQITEKQIKGKLADWYPQVNFDYTSQHWFQIRSNLTQLRPTPIKLGVANYAFGQFSLNQQLFNRDVLLASKTSSTVRLQAEQNTQSSKIDLIVNVSKAFYDVLASVKQIEVSRESVVRLQRSVRDAKNRYNSGLSDKTDYQRAMISLRNAETQLKSNSELLRYKEQALKSLMGYPQEQEITLMYDLANMVEDVLMDTTQEINYQSHIDFKLMQTQKELQKANIQYSKWAFLPSVSVSGFYNLYYQSKTFGDLYNKNYPFSYFTANLNFPIFQGNKRVAKVQEQRLASDRLDEGIRNLKNNLSTEYTRSMATYKSNLYNFNTQKENTELAEEVYHVISLQYQNGVKTYLDMIVAETDLRTSRINYYNALYQVLASKMDVQRALGQINY